MQHLFLTPFTTLAQLNRKDIVDQLPARVVQLSLTLHKTFSQLQNGQLRFYITTLACAAIIILASTLVIQVL